MEAGIIRSEELEEKNYGDTNVTNILNTEEHPPLSIAKVCKIGDDVKIGLDPESDVAYYVSEGEGICVIEDKENKIKKGKIVPLIPDRDRKRRFEE